MTSRTRYAASLAMLGALAAAEGVGRAAFPRSQTVSAAADMNATAGFRVVVSITPFKELAERLAPPGSAVEVLIPPGVSEHGYEIPPRSLAALADADLVVFVGLGLEPQVPRFLANQPRAGRKVVEFAAAAGEVAEAGGDAVGEGHVHDEHCEHHHGADPHLWLDPRLVAERLVPALAAAIREGLMLRGAADADTLAALDQRAEALRSDLMALDAAFEARLKPASSRTVVVGHDAFARLAQRYGLTTVAVHGLAAQEPKPSAIAEAKRVVREHGLKVVFSEPQLSPRAAKRIAEATGAEVVALDPLGDGRYFAFMRANLEALCRALACGPGVADAAAR